MKRPGLAIALTLFLGGLLLAIDNVPDAAERLRPAMFLLLVLVGVPASIVLNAAEFRIGTQVVGTAIRWRSAFETTILASAANILPLPGGALVRLAAMKAVGT